jgi:hypothetical protein
MDNSKGFNTRRIAVSGLLAALAVLLLFFAAVMPTNKLSLYALSSFFISIIVTEYGIGAGWTFYAATGLLALAIVPGKIATLPYIAFFGIYGIAKYYIEKLNNIFTEYVLKLLYFNILLIISILFAQLFLDLGLTSILPWWIIVIISEVVFVIYDYAYSLFIQFYRQRLHKFLGTKR